MARIALHVLAFWALVCATQLAFASQLEEKSNKVSSVSVEGIVFCDQCLQNKITKSSNLLNGAQVALLCESQSAEGAATVVLTVTTDEKGRFAAELPAASFDGAGKISCAAELRQSPRKSCQLPATPRRTSPAFSRRGSVDGKVVYSVGTLSYRPKSAGMFCARASYYSPSVPSPVYKPPVYKPPVYKPPVEKPPVYKPPVEQPPYKPPVYKSPVYKPPVYKPPVEKPPVYKPPPYKPPVYKPPVEKPPVYKPPVEKPPVYKPPVEKPPVYKPPVEKPPVYKPPVEKPPVYKPPVYKPPVEKPPVYKPPTPYSEPKYKFPKFKFPKFKFPKFSFPKFKFPYPKDKYAPKYPPQP